MSIKGIDTQIMITRTTDFAKDASAMQKKPEMTQEFLAAQTKISDAQAQGRVAGTEHTEMETIRTDVDGGAGGGHGGDGGGKHNRDDDDEVPMDMRVSPSNNIIDITV